jgi:hypothetical protein
MASSFTFSRSSSSLDIMFNQSSFVNEIQTKEEEEEQQQHNWN